MLAMREPSSRPGTAVGTGRAFFLMLLIPFLWPLGDVRAEDNLDAMQAEISGHIQANELPEARKAAEKYRELLEKTVGQSDFGVMATRCKISPPWHLWKPISRRLRPSRSAP